MPNISICNSCNRRCDYCFQREWYLSNKTHLDESSKEMSVEEFDALINWFVRAPNGRNFPISLMGGEPLMHSKIFELLDVLRFYGMRASLISNISVDTEIIDRLIDEFLKPNTFHPISSGLFNTDYPKNQREIFLTNFRKICHTDLKFSISTTLLQSEKEAIEAGERIAELVAIYKEIRGSTAELRIRVAPYCPNQNEKRIDTYKFFNFSKVLATFLNVAWKNGVVGTNLDCSVNMCELDWEAYRTFVNSGVLIRNEMCEPKTGCPFDILVDGSVIWCSSADFIRLENWKNYPNVDICKDALDLEWRKYWTSTTLKCDYINCGEFNPAKCLGVCAAKNRFIENQIKRGKTIAISSH